MTKAEAQQMLKTLNDSQKYALRDALDTGINKMLDLGSTKLRRDWCDVSRGYRSSIAASTRRSLSRRGLTDHGDSWRACLSIAGMKVARLAYEEWLSDYEPRDDDDGEPAFKPTTPEEYVKGYRDERDRMNREHEQRVKRAARLWRGLKLADPHWRTESKAISSAIKVEINESAFGSGGSLDLDLDDLIAIGEQIEKLRNPFGDAKVLVPR